MDCNCFKKEGKNCIEIVPIFSNLNYEEMMEVARITREEIFEKGEMIYMAGDKGEKLYVIHSGKVKITRLTSSGKEQVIRVLGPGEFMGELSLFSSLPLTDNGEALSKTTVCMIDGEKLKELMKKYPTIALKAMEELSRRLENVENLIENISLQGVEKRLATSLMTMANDKGEISLKMSKRDLASHLGMSQETLSRKLTAFQDMGIIKLIGHRRILLLDIEALEDIK
ncbi:Crp/Fnr family transcriptional regulator [Tissierella sp. MB52-C2]|uniref:Crp/Fnr family transcriptional regulator n=1 Tax=Tissierella sp. MB52-C2 TaxID=3070999 RepID=UPI00280AC5D2|nr:Crp/Fnr family transcriptional regulator [Tissierella sp. MB52-C2]WMM25090.1 Crp/Fnr family transcriptional regulator [Tissierella sp. MB52-C2]